MKKMLYGDVSESVRVCMVWNKSKNSRQMLLYVFIHLPTLSSISTTAPGRPCVFPCPIQSSGEQISGISSQTQYLQSRFLTPSVKICILYKNDIAMHSLSPHHPKRPGPNNNQAQTPTQANRTLPPYKSKSPITHNPAIHISTIE